MRDGRVNQTLAPKFHTLHTPMTPLHLCRDHHHFECPRVPQRHTYEHRLRKLTLICILADDKPKIGPSPSWWKEQNSCTWRLCDVSVTGAWGRIDDSVTAERLERRSWHAAEHSGWEYKTTYSYNNEIHSSSIRQTRQQEM